MINRAEADVLRKTNWLFLVKLNGQLIGIESKGKPLAGDVVGADGLCLNAIIFQLTYHILKLVHFESQVAQTGSFGPRNPGRRIGKRKKFDHIITIQREVELIR